MLLSLEYSYVWVIEHFAQGNGNEGRLRSCKKSLSQPGNADKQFKQFEE